MGSRFTAARRAEVVEVHRHHGAEVAADWCGANATTVRQWRFDADGYRRGQGHPSTAELAARAPRVDCPCPICVEHRRDPHSSVWTAAQRAELLGRDERHQGQQARGRMRATLSGWRAEASFVDPR